jgi:hypothetical protein
MVEPGSGKQYALREGVRIVVTSRQTHSGIRDILTTTLQDACVLCASGWNDVAIRVKSFGRSCRV